MLARDGLLLHFSYLARLLAFCGTVQRRREGRTGQMEGELPWCQEGKERQGTTTKAKNILPPGCNVHSFVVALEISCL